MLTPIIKVSGNHHLGHQRKPHRLVQKTAWPAPREGGGPKKLQGSHGGEAKHGAGSPTSLHSGRCVVGGGLATSPHEDGEGN